jgi:hypothetical protein
VSIALTLVTGAQAAQPIALHCGALSAEIRPDTLETTLTGQDAVPLPISAPLATPAPVRIIELSDARVRFELTNCHITVTACLTSQSLDLQFAAAREGRFTWPIMRATPTTRAFILPMFEGVCMPTDNAAAMQFLLEHGPMNTTADLSMPFWGVDVGPATLTYIATNPFNNELVFDGRAPHVTARFTHEFTRNNALKEYGLMIQAGPAVPTEPAQRYRAWLTAQGLFVSMAEKIRTTPEATKLPGAAHIYLWGDAALAPHNVKDWQGLCRQLKEADAATTPGPARRVWELLTPEGRKAIAELATSPWADRYLQRNAADALSTVLQRRDLYSTSSWETVVLPAAARSLMTRDEAQLAPADVLRLNGELLRAAFPDHFEPVENWGDGYSPAMVDALAEAGFDRLWLGLPSQKGMLLHPAVVTRARQRGYLIGPYDSYHSIHSPELRDETTWETAQFDAHLYDTGPVIGADGSRVAGFARKGFRLSSIAARPWVEQRVRRLMQAAPCNSWFLDCDAFGELNDDYSPLHPTTQQEDVRARLARMAWIRDTYGAVIGSEGGSAYAAPVIHFAHGMVSPGFGWGDRDLTTRTSPWYLGGWYPPDGPAVFMKQVPLKPKYRMPYYDPQVRVPLYETVFHDSVIATHQWGFPSLKFRDAQTTVALIEALYQVPPLYHLNRAEFGRIRSTMRRTYQFLSPLLRKTALMPMTGFAWLTPDKLVQRTEFGGRIEIIANFGENAWTGPGASVPPHCALAIDHDSGTRQLYRPASADAATDTK